jgi:hypothetical protein
VLIEANREVPHLWIEELLLQSYLFAGFPRALKGIESRNMMRLGTFDRESVVERNRRISGAEAL